VVVGSASVSLRRAPPLTPANPARSKCWGSNYYGQLGLGDTLARGDGADQMGENLPSVDLGANWTVVEVAAGYAHTCVRLENGVARAVKCWGLNNYGELGLGNTTSRGDGGGEMGDSLAAVQLGTGRSAVALALGKYFSCALLDDASVKCWGVNTKQNSAGQLGLGDVESRGDGGGEMGDSLPAVPLCLEPCPAGYQSRFMGADGCLACPRHHTQRIPTIPNESIRNESLPNTWYNAASQPW
jgi:hypothetical protein